MERRLTFAFILALFGGTAAYPQVNLNLVPSRTVGHPQTPLLEQNSLYSFSPNLVEGRELYQPLGIAVDASANPPALYVSDTGNNRVLGWKDAAGFANGQKADIVIGQTDFYTTWAQGPGVAYHAPGQGSSLQSGLNGPTGLAVRNGDLWVADSGNNRILRYPKPFANADHIPDIVVGQPGLNSRSANYTGAVSARGVAFTSGSTVYQANLAFDKDGNLWVTDPGNRRVLEYAAADASSAGTFGPAAILEIGQLDFTSLQPNLSPSQAASKTTTNQFAIPSALAFDPQGRLYVSDADGSQPQNLSRVLVFAPPFSNGMSASRIMGVVFSNQQTTQPQIMATVMNDPSGIFFPPDGTWIGVVDTNYSRVLIFPPYDQWPASSTQYSPMASTVIGHSLDFTRTNPNDAPPAATYYPPASNSVFYLPAAAVLFNNELYMTDAANNRVLVIPSLGGNPPGFGAATRVLGQTRFDVASINLVEGREFRFTANGLNDSGVAIDSTGAVPHLYVADPGNNRVLGFRDMRKLAAGAPADLIIGQPGGDTALVNYPSNDPARPTASSLYSPTGVLVDSSGNLWVADRGNGRVLRFPAPFNQTGQPAADLVLGQRDFTSKVTDPTAGTMGAPYGLAMTYDSEFKVNGKLLVSDQAHNRVLIFEPVDGVFTSGQAAGKVIGQPDFKSTAAGNDLASFNAPHHIAVDTSALVYVADTANNRVLIFNSVSALPTSSATAALRIGSLNAPEGVYVSPRTGEIWVGDTANGKAIRYPRYDDLAVGQGTTFTVAMPSYTLALAQDNFGALVAADATNRVAFYFPQLAVQNAANFLSTDLRPLAPGTWASVYRMYEGQFGSTQEIFSQVPLPDTLADTQVFYNGVAAPLTLVSPTQINFYVPMNAPTSGLADLTVVRKSTGQVLGATLIRMSTVAPALFTLDQNSTATSRQAAVINHDDGTVNSPTNPAKRGSYVEIYGTGQGSLPGAPPDGSPAPSSPLVRTTGSVRVFLGSDYLDCSGCLQGQGELQYTGLAPGLLGVWQINIKIPANIDPTRAAVLVVQLDSVASGGLGLTGYNTVIYVK